MRAKVYGTRVSIIVIVIATVLIIFGINQSSDISENIGYGVLGSGIVSLVISIAEYLTVKRETLIQYYLEAYKLVNAFDTCEYYELTDREIALSVMKWKNNMKTLSREVENYWDLEQEALMTLSQEVGVNPEGLSNSDLAEALTDKFCDTDKIIIKKMEPYILASQVDTMSFENAYGNIYFMFDLCGKARKKLYNDIHLKIQRKKNDLCML